MKKRDRLILLGTLVGLAVMLFFARNLKNKKDEAKQEPTTVAPTRPIAMQATPRVVNTTPVPQSAQIEQRRRSVELVRSSYSAPIAFYGKVRDQYGQPVPGALVDYSIVDKYLEPASKKSDIADENGYFSLTGVQGAAVTVGVSKEGYDPIYQQSNGAFSFGVPYDPNRDRPTPTKDNPTVFVLRKKAQAEPMVQLRSRQYEIAKDGTPAEVDLETGKRVPAGRGHLRVEYWVNDQAKDAQGHFDWKCRLSVPGGGLVERDAENQFEAPENGYRGADEIVVAADNPRERWSYSAEKQYFFKLANGRYARAKLNFYTGNRTIFVLEAYLNPSGSRNLEYETSKQVSVH